MLNHSTLGLPFLYRSARPPLGVSFSKLATGAQMMKSTCSVLLLGTSLISTRFPTPSPLNLSTLGPHVCMIMHDHLFGGLVFLSSCTLHHCSTTHSPTSPFSFIPIMHEFLCTFPYNITPLITLHT